MTQLVFHFKQPASCRDFVANEVTVMGKDGSIILEVPTPRFVHACAEETASDQGAGSADGTGTLSGANGTEGTAGGQNTASGSDGSANETENPEDAVASDGTASGQEGTAGTDASGTSANGGITPAAAGQPERRRTAVRKLIRAR